MIKHTRRFGIGGLCLLISLLCLLPLYALAEVDIDDNHFPDRNFQAYLRSLPEGADGLLTDEEIKNITSINVYNKQIENLSGIKVFKFLTILDCSRNQLTALPELPDGLTTLYCYNNTLTALPKLPDGLTMLSCYNNTLTALPKLPGGLTTLSCGENSLTALPQLPGGLKMLYCYDNTLTALPKLPDGLTTLYCYDNTLTALPKLPDGLKTLSCYNNTLTVLPELPDGLINLFCYNNQLTTLPKLPDGLKTLWCDNNQLTALPKLPDGLEQLYCYENQLTAVDLSSLSNLAYYLGRDQTPTLLLIANGAGGYSLAIELNMPTTLANGLSYANGVLTSDSKDLDESPFQVQTGQSGKRLWGTLTLTYAEIISASAGEGGSITPSGQVGVVDGENQTFAIAPDEGYRIQDVLVNGTSIGVVTSYTFDNVQASGSIAAQFEQADYTITATAGKGGSIAPAGAVGVLHGESQAFAITADAGYRVKDVKVNGKSLGVMNSYTFSNVQADATIEAIFEERPIDPVPPTGDRFPLEMLFVSLVGMVLVAVMLLRKAKKA